MNEDTRTFQRKSRSAAGPKANRSLRLSPQALGQSCPQQYPQVEELGQPLTIREAAALIGCSPWTVRQQYLPAGLPHHRLSPQGKLIFYRNQIIRWLHRQQEKEGIIA